MTGNVHLWQLDNLKILNEDKKLEKKKDAQS